MEDVIKKMEDNLVISKFTKQAPATPSVEDLIERFEDARKTLDLAIADLQKLRAANKEHTKAAMDEVMNIARSLDR